MNCASRLKKKKKKYEHFIWLRCGKGGNNIIILITRLDKEHSINQRISNMFYHICFWCIWFVLLSFLFNKFMFYFVFALWVLSSPSLWCCCKFINSSFLRVFMLVSIFLFKKKKKKKKKKKIKQKRKEPFIFSFSVLVVWVNTVCFLW